MIFHPIASVMWVRDYGNPHNPRINACTSKRCKFRRFLESLTLTLTISRHYGSLHSPFAHQCHTFESHSLGVLTCLVFKFPSSLWMYYLRKWRLILFFSDSLLRIREILKYQKQRWGWWFGYFHSFKPQIDEEWLSMPFSIIKSQYGTLILILLIVGHWKVIPRVGT